MGNRPPYASILTESTAHVQGRGSILKEDLGSNCERPSSTTLDLGGQFAVMDADSVVVLDTGASAILVRYMWLGHHSNFSERWGVPRVETYPACARSKFGDRRFGEVP